MTGRYLPSALVVSYIAVPGPSGGANREGGSAVATFITRLEARGSGPRVAVKDIIDVAGVPTTAGCRAIASVAEAAERDAACLAGCRAADARLVGKANLHELAMLPMGTNPWFGTPVNPLDPGLIPGGSSSGSAVAVATGEADVALGSDTGGSVRVPAACCGVFGLKTTHGRISLEGVWPLAPSMDTIGPMATSVAGLALGMELLEPGFAIAPSAAGRIGRVRTSGLPEIEAAVDHALRAAELGVVELPLSGWDLGSFAFTAIYFSELWDADHELVEQHRDGVGDDIAATVGMAETFRPQLAEALEQREQWQANLAEIFEQVDLLALPTLPIFPPRLDELQGDPTPIAIELSKHNSLFNAGGTPCLAQPIPVAGNHLPASLQLVGPWHSENLLLATAELIATRHDPPRARQVAASRNPRRS
jgi:amidase